MFLDNCLTAVAFSRDEHFNDVKVKVQYYTVFVSITTIQAIYIFYRNFHLLPQFPATNTEKTLQLSSQLFGKAPAKSGILGRNYHKKGPRNPGGTDKSLSSK